MRRRAAPTDFAYRRGRIADTYLNESTDRLLEILEREEYVPPMDAHMGVSVILRELFLFRRREWTGAVLARLRDLDPAVLPDSWPVRLRRYLAVVDGDAATLLAEWWEKPREEREGFDFLDLIDCLGFLRVPDIAFIRDLVRVFPLGVCMLGAEMEALGRIGPPAAMAAEAIRACIPTWHSPPLRERVLQRLSTPETDWLPCPNCDTGWVREAAPRRLRLPCRACRGLMVVPLGES